MAALVDYRSHYYRVLTRFILIQYFPPVIRRLSIRLGFQRLQNDMFVDIIDIRGQGGTIRETFSRATFVEPVQLRQMVQELSGFLDTDEQDARVASFPSFVVKAGDLWFYMILQPRRHAEQGERSIHDESGIPEHAQAAGPFEISEDIHQRQMLYH